MKRYYPFLSAEEIDPQKYLVNNLKIIVEDWKTHVAGYLEQRDKFKIHFVFYERLLNSFEKEIDNLLAYLDIKLDKNKRRLLRAKVDFAAMKKDNPTHLRKGEARQWQNKLTKTQKNQVLEITNTLLEYLNYPSNNSEHKLPELPSHLPENYLDTAGKVVLLIPAPH